MPREQAFDVQIGLWLTHEMLAEIDAEVIRRMQAGAPVQGGDEPGIANRSAIVRDAVNDWIERNGPIAAQAARPLV